MSPILIELVIFLVALLLGGLGLCVVYCLESKGDTQVHIPILIVIIGVIAGLVLFATKSKGQTETQPPVTPPVCTSPIRFDKVEFGFFDSLLGQTGEFSNSVTYVWVNDLLGDQSPANIAWKNQQMMMQMQEAKNLGIKKVVLAIGDLTFTSQYKAYKGVGELIALKQLLDANGLSNMVMALYPVDEPDLWGVSDATMTQAIHDIKVAWPGPAVAVIYSGSGNMPGHDAFDWLGRDNYGEGVQVLNELPPLNPGQRWIIVPGGANNPNDVSGWHQDPKPFYAFALSHPQVIMISAFIWQDYYAAGVLGIRSNGMAPAYLNVGAQAKLAQAGL